MIKLADLQSALTLLSATKTSQSDQPPTAAQIVKVLETAISGAENQPSIPALYTMSISETFSEEDGQIEGTFQGTTSGSGAPAITDSAEYKSFEEELSENSLTSQQLTADAENNVPLTTGEYNNRNFLGDINQDYNEGVLSVGEASAIVQALTTGTLQIQNAADVQGLNYNWQNSLQMTDGSGTDKGNFSVNTAFLNADADGKQHALVDFGLVAAYLTW